MFKNIEKICIRENIRLTKMGLKDHSFGNVSIKINDNLFFIKPSGVNVSKVKIGQCPIISIDDGKVYGKNRLKPSVDTATHIEIYKKFSNIKSVSHCHSLYATAWAQSSKPIPLLGTTHADFWEKEIPLVRHIKKNELINYEMNTGKLIIQKLKKNKINPSVCPGVIVSGHGQFAWGNEFNKAVSNSKLIEFVAKTALVSLQIGIKKKLPKYISDFHYSRKHSKKKYYGQC